jgi:multimeric flavodoxin WrbA
MTTTEQKTLCLLGSPRRDGNTGALAQRFCDRAAHHGAPVEQVPLIELSYAGCANLFRCKTDLTHCAQKDDLTAVLGKVAEAQVLVLASPVYFTNVTGTLKCAIDRLFSFLVPDYAVNSVKSRLGSGRTLVFIQTQGESEERYRDLLDSYSGGFGYLGYDHQHLVRAWGVREAGDVVNNSEFMERCDIVADAIYGG